MLLSSASEKNAINAQRYRPTCEKIQRAVLDVS
jgi:hypothetical protein